MLWFKGICFKFSLNQLYFVFVLSHIHYHNLKMEIKNQTGLKNFKP